MRGDRGLSESEMPVLRGLYICATMNQSRVTFWDNSHFASLF